MKLDLVGRWMAADVVDGQFRVGRLELTRHRAVVVRLLSDRAAHLPREDSGLDARNPQRVVIAGTPHSLFRGMVSRSSDPATA